MSSLGRFDDEPSRQKFCEKVWTGIEQHGQRNPLIRRYQRCCNDFFVCGEVVDEHQNSDVVAAVQAIKANKNRDELLRLVTARIHADHLGIDCTEEDQRAAEHLITIAFEISLMCNIEFGHVNSNSAKLSARQLAWDNGDVKTLIAHAFPKTNNLDGRGRLPRTFHARNMERLGSIRIVWSHNLLDHLRLHEPAEEGQPFTVTVFHYAQFLRSAEQSSLFPEGLISETLRSLALLFPGYVGGTNRWFEQQQIGNKDLDISACFCAFSDSENRTIESFTYWRDRITILKQTYDESEPRTILQWWNDGRKRERWATFWVAAIVLILTIFFGVISIIEGALQVYKAYHPS